eukprot:4334244-Pyramimonas_sp.AAC.1
MASAPDRVEQQAVVVLKHYWNQTIKEDKPDTLRVLEEHVRYCRVRACWFDKKSGKTTVDQFKLQLMVGPLHPERGGHGRRHAADETQRGSSTNGSSGMGCRPSFPEVWHGARGGGQAYGRLNDIPTEAVRPLRPCQTSSQDFEASLQVSEATRSRPLPGQDYEASLQ